MATDDAPSFGNLLLSLRVAAGLTQEALAERAGLSVRAISSLERGERQRPYPHTVQVLARALRLPAADRARLAAARQRRPSTSQATAPTPTIAPIPPIATNLPAPLTSFVGREREAAEVRQLLGETRLLTLTGTGGVGKTRLALAVAHMAAADYPDGVWFVDLAPLIDPALIPQAIARVLGVSEQPGQPLTDTLIAWLTDRTLLLVLDNCEHLVEAGARLAGALLAACPQLRLLATSREPLCVGGELAWRVPSLELPDPARPAVAELARSEAARLFVERAGFARPGFAITAVNAAAVVEISRRLDGIPLAIELAAARVRVLPIDQIAARLDDAIGLLTGGSRVAPPRQQTLRATLDWSYDLLTEPERMLLRRLAVFAGGWTLAAAETVCADVDLAPTSVLDLLTTLVDKSLVVADTDATEAARYRLLEPVRQYALEHLATAGDEVAVRGQHVAWCLALAELDTADQVTWLARLDAERDNLRAALAWGHAAAPAAGLRLAAALRDFWFLRNDIAEGQHWLNALLDRAPAPTAIRMHALRGAGRLARLHGDAATARTQLEESLALSRQLGDRKGTTAALVNLGLLLLVLGEYSAARALFEERLALAQQAGDGADEGGHLISVGLVDERLGEYARARALLERSLPLVRAAGDRFQVALALHTLGVVVMDQGEWEHAERLLDESLVEARAVGVPQLIAASLCDLGNLARRRGDLEHARQQYEAGLSLMRTHGARPDMVWHLVGLGRVAQGQGEAGRALALLEEGLTLARATGLRPDIARALHGLGAVVGQQGDAARATTLLRESLALRHEMGERPGVIECLEGLAAVAAGSGQPTRAVRLLGAAAAQRAAIGAPLSPSERPGFEAMVAAARKATGEAVVDAAWAAGQVLTIEQAVTEALADVPAASPQPSTDTLPAALTSFVGREHEIGEVRRLLSETRLLTLTGTGGVGKTRLALAAAQTLQGVYPDGVRLVELAALTDPALVAQAVAQALNVREQPGQALTESVIAWLADKTLLLVLDNCEHLLEACAGLTATLLRACPRVRVLATSRSVLGTAGETVWRVPSLAEAAATRLFVERARAARPDFDLTPTTAALVAGIGWQLDGIPLAIELAAARVRVLTVEQIAARLDDRFRLLAGDDRSTLPRQRTLRATLDWSHDLLTEEERTVLRRLAIFAGGWTLGAAEAVCADEALPAGDILATLSRLVDQSLVQVDATAKEARYRLLETVRQYAAERLAASDEAAAVRARHAAWCLALTERAELEIQAADQLTWLARLEAERDNLRAALAWSLDADPATGLRLAASLCTFWFMRNDLAEGQRWLGGLLARVPAPTTVRSRALLGAGRLARQHGDSAVARDQLEASLALSRRLGDRPASVHALRNLGNLDRDLGEYAAARARYEECLAFSQQAGDGSGQAVHLILLGQVDAFQGEYARAWAWLDQGLPLARAAGNRYQVANALVHLGMVALHQGELERAETLMAESLATVQDVSVQGTTQSLFWLGTLAHQRGDLALASQHYEASLALARANEDRYVMPRNLVGLGRVAQLRGDAARAMALLQEGLMLARATGFKPDIALALHGLGLAAEQQGDAASATAHLRESLALRRDMGERLGIAEGLEGMASVAAGSGQPERTARLLSAAAALRATIGAPLPPVERPGHEATMAAARTALGAPAFDAAWAAGGALAVDQAVAEALTDAPAAPPRPTIGNLPASLTSFIGRTEEMAEVGRLLATHRLVTLTGAGGVGKTRLALEVARGVPADYPDGIWLVELAPLADPTMVPSAVVAALGLPEAIQPSILARLVAFLTSQRSLLILDNCEHLIEACAALAEALLRGCPTLTILATSREPLGITGEAAWRVPSLALPAAATALTAGQAAQVEAMRLFVERATLVQPHFAVTDETASVVAEICRRLDGIPLALELAAARARVLPVEQIARRLDERFRLLTGGSRTAPPRQQTLRATLDWSHDLLTEPERALLRRLAVFVGGWTLDAAEAVGAGDDITRDAVLDLLTHLIDKSLAQVDDHAGTARYRLLETVRQYALERLDEADGESNAARDRHAAYYLTLIELATAGGREALVEWVDQLRPEWGNVFAALRWAAATGQVERALLASGALNELWMLASQYVAPARLLAELLAMPDASAATPGRAQALLCACELAHSQNDTAAATVYLREALALCRALGDEPGVCRALVMAGWTTALTGDMTTGRVRLEEALPLIRAGGEKYILAGALHFLGYIAYRQGEIAHARLLQDETLVLARQAGVPRTIASALFRLGEIAVAEGDHRLARARLAEAATTIRPVSYLVVWSGLLRCLALLAAAEGRPVQVLRLAGAAQRLIEAAGVPLERFDLTDVAVPVARCRAMVGEPAAAAAWAAGRALTPEEALAEALTDGADPSTAEVEPTP